MVKAKSAGDLYAELEKLPEHLVGEVLGGELVVRPRPGPRHTMAMSRMGARIGSLFDQDDRGDWWIFVEPELHLASDIVIPDLAGWRRERMPTLPKTAYFSLPPDWVCEILSESTASIDRSAKMPIYGREGVPYLWLVDPIIRTLEVFLLREAGWLLHSVHREDATVNAPPFEEASLRLSAWWPPEASQAPEADP